MMMHECSNIMANLPSGIPDEVFETLVSSDVVRIERIISVGQATADGEWLSQIWDEWVILLAGSAELLCDGDVASQILKPGDYLLIPAGCRHRVEWTDPEHKTVWLAVHFIGSKNG